MRKNKLISPSTKHLLQNNIITLSKNKLNLKTSVTS